MSQKDVSTEYIERPGRDATEGHGGKILVLWGILGLLVVITYLWTLRDLWIAWLIKDSFGLAFLSLGAAGVLIWDRSEKIRKVEPEGSWLGLPILIGSLVFLVVGTRAVLVFPGGMTSVFVRWASLLTFLFGMGMLIWGPQRMRYLGLPAVILLFACPENYVSAVWLPQKLQHLSTIATREVIEGLGITVKQTGKVLETSVFAANIERGCTGMRSLLTVIPTSLFLGALALREIRNKFIFVVFSCVLAVVANLVRLTVTVLMGHYVGRESAEGFFHFFAGFGGFVVCLAVMLGALKLLKKMESKGTDDLGDDQADKDDGFPVFNWGSIRPKYALVTGVTVLAIAVAYQGYELRTVTQVREALPVTPQELMPVTVGQWKRNKATAVPGEVSRLVENGELFSYSYRQSNGPEIRVFLLYWRPHIAPPSLKSRDPSLVFSKQFEAFDKSQARVFAVRVDGKETPMKTRILPFSRQNALATTWQGTRLGKKSNLPNGYVGKIVLGLKRALLGERARHPEVAFCIYSKGNWNTERFLSAHRLFARHLLGWLSMEVLTASS